MTWKLEINTESTVVTLNLRDLNENDTLNSQTLLSALKEKYIPITDQIKQNITSILETLANSKNSIKDPVLAKATPPVRGTDGYFEWNENFDPEKIKAAMEKMEKSKESHYERSSLIIAAQGDVLGIYHPHTTGTSGKDVFGKIIKPEPGSALEIKIGANVILNDDNVTYVAECDGIPKMENSTLSIDPTLLITTNIDFATGNVKYSGNVHIKGDVKDLFEVQSGGNTDIEGTIEAAKVHCDGNLSVKRGISGKGKGTVRVHQNLSAKYLSNVIAWVRGDTLIESEIVNTELNCQGKVHLNKGAIHGGQVTAAGTIESPIIGSPAAVRTVLKAAVDPFLEQEMINLREKLEKHNETIINLMPKAKNLLALCRGKPNEELKAMADQIRESKEAAAKLDQEIDDLKNKIEETCNGTIIAHKLIYPGTYAHIGDTLEIINHEIKGPVEIFLKKDGPFKNIAFRTPGSNE